MHNLARQAPAGRSIPWAAAWGRAGSEPLQPWAERRVRYFDSGTAALAVAIRIALERLGSSNDGRTVVLPAYGCPDLLAATIWAGGEPEFVDYESDAVAPDRSTLLRRLQQQDAVIVAVDSFGVDSLGPDFKASLSSEQTALLVHDLAQSYAPYEPNWAPVASSSIVSFAKAKPISLTTGGALISSSARSKQPGDVSGGGAPASRGMVALRAFAYNVSLNPLAFGLLSRIPALRIGQTHYTPLRDVHEYGHAFSRHVAAAILADTAAKAEHIASVREMLELVATAGCELPKGVSQVPTGARLWRLPVICPSAEMAAGFVNKFGSLGVSRLYERVLPEFAGTERATCAIRWPYAFNVADRLVTLPTHGRLGGSNRARLLDGLQAMAGKKSNQVTS